LFVFDHHGLDHELHLHRQREVALHMRVLVLAGLLRTRRDREGGGEKQRDGIAHHQNLSLMVNCTLRIGLAATGSPNRVLPKVVFQLVNTG